jgi:hypothetical protein
MPSLKICKKAYKKTFEVGYLQFKAKILFLLLKSTMHIVSEKKFRILSIIL